MESRVGISPPWEDGPFQSRLAVQSTESALNPHKIYFSFLFFSLFFFFFFFSLLFFTSEESFFVIHSLSCSSAYIRSRCSQHPFVYSAYPLVFLPKPYHFYILHQSHHVVGFLPVSHFINGISMVGSRISNELSRTTSDGKPESYRFHHRCQPGERNSQVLRRRLLHPCAKDH